MDIQRHSFDFSWRSIFRVVLVVLVVIFLYIIRDVLAILFLAIIISSAVSPLAQKLISRFRIPKLLAVIIIYLLGIGLFLGFIAVLIPTLFNDVTLFVINMPEIIDKFSGVFQNFFGFSLADVLDMPIDFQDLIGKVTDIFGRTIVGFARTVSRFAGTSTSVLSVLALSFYLSIRRGSFENIIRVVFPPQHYSYILELQDRVQEKIGRWFAGQVVLGLIIGMLVYIGLTILGVNYALILAIIAALMELVPVAGPIIAAIPSIIIALLQDPILGVATLLLYIIIQQLENHFIVPNVMKRAVGLNPVLIILSLLIGFKLGGIVGMIISVPLAVTVLEILTDINDKKILDHKT